MYRIESNQTLPVPEPREVIGLSASFSGIAAMLVLATLAPHPASPEVAASAAPAVAAEVRAMDGATHAVGV